MKKYLQLVLPPPLTCAYHASTWGEGNLFGPHLILLLSGNFQRPKAMDTTLPPNPLQKKIKEGNGDSNLNVSIENIKKMSFDLH